MKRNALKVLALFTIIFASCKEKEQKETATEEALIFPKGEKVNSKNFNGATWLQTLVNSDSLNDIKIGNVTFEPGARTAWHLHPGGQILLVTGGTGYYQEKGSPGRILHKGDVVKCRLTYPTGTVPAKTMNLSR